MVGGTGLYLRAALADLDLKPPAPPEIRARLEADVAARGTHALHAELARRAPWAAEGIAPTDRQRIVRALELRRDRGARAAAGRKPALDRARRATRRG